MKHLILAAFCAAFLAAPSAALSAPAPSRDPEPLEGTVVSQTEYSNTAVSENGVHRTQVAPYPINFKDGDGDWNPVDTDLESAGNGKLRPAAIDGEAAIPTTLASALELAHDGREISFKLRGAKGSRSVDAGTATFANALPSVDITYQARSLGLKETLVLKTAAAQQTFTYDLSADADLTASVEHGAVYLRNSEGKARFRIDAPLAWDSATPASYSNAVELSISKVIDGEWVLTVTPDSEWLKSPARAYPVFIDPDYYWYDAKVMRFHGAVDCALENGSAANQSYCASSVLKASRKTTVAKPILKFDVTSAIPSNATVSSAIFRAYAPGTVARLDSGMRLRTVTSDWDSNATWNDRKTGVPWTTPGGDVSTDPTLIGPITDVGYAGYWYYWDAPTQAVQHWVDGTLPNYGFQLDPEPYYDPANQVAYYFTATEFFNTSWWPVLDVAWTVPDTSAPPIPTDVVLGDLEPISGVALLGFSCPDDLVVVGAATSGRADCELQISKNSGSYTAWQVVDGSELPIIDLAEGDDVDVRLRNRDNADNVSTVVQESFIAESVPDYSDEIEAGVDHLVEVFDHDPSEAEVWLNVQESAEDAASELRAAAGSAYAGMWYDNEEMLIRIQVLNSSRDANIEDSAEFLGIAGYLEIDVVPGTTEELVQDAGELSDALLSLLEEHKVIVSPFEPGHEILLLVDPSATVLERADVAAAALTVDTPVTVEQLDEPLPVEENDVGCDRRGARTFCDLPPRAGALMLTRRSKPEDEVGSCSVGFLADEAVPLGQPLSETAYVLTAGHCVDNPDNQGDAWYQAPRTTESDPDSVVDNLSRVPQNGDGELGSVESGEYWSWEGQGYNDFAAIKLLPTVAQAARKPYYHQQDPDSGGVGKVKLVQATEAPLFGRMACGGGGSTGSHCAIVTGTFQGINQGQFNTNICDSRGGDSGGPVVYRGNAQGIHNGRARFGLNEDPSSYVSTFRRAWKRYKSTKDVPKIAKCSSSTRGYTFSTYVNVAERLMGVKVRTSSKPAPGDLGKIRARMTWDTGADIDLHAFYRATPGGPVIHANWTDLDAIPGGVLKIDLSPSRGPETFIEPTPSSKTITFAACHYGLVPPNGGKTKVRLELYDPSTQETTERQVELGVQGAGDYFGTSPDGPRVEPVGPWCDQGNTGYPAPDGIGGGDS